MSQMKEVMKKGLENIQNNGFNSAWLKYVIKCILSLTVCYFIYIKFPNMPINWSMVSAVLVLAPLDTETNKLAFDRMKANIIGSLIGLIGFVMFDTNLYILCIATIITIVLCMLIKLGSATRSALASLVIVMIQEKAINSWLVALERMGCVILGCVIALAVSILLDRIISLRLNQKNNN